jgi:hypothetical protein
MMLHGLFHTLWTKAVGTKDYDKRQWLEFETKLNDQAEVLQRFIDFNTLSCRKHDEKYPEFVGLSIYEIMDKLAAEMRSVLGRDS